MKRFCFLTLVPLMILLNLPGVSADPFIDSIVSITPGSGGGFGSENLPDVILGAPEGAGEFAQSLDVFSLGDGGSITLEFTDNTVINGPGPDLIVFENPFYVAQNPLNIFSEVAFVEVSQDGVVYHRFSNDYNPAGDPVNNPANWTGFAGVMPVLSNSENGIDPTDPAVAGGDAFELDDVGLDWIRFVRIVDTGESPDAASDDDGDEIYDQGMPGGSFAGFDLDAVAAVHWEDLYTPTPVETPVPTATAVPSLTPTPRPTPTPGFIVCDLILSGTHFSPGDRFILDAKLWNPDEESLELNLIVIFEIAGRYYFRPAWTEMFQGEGLTLDSGTTNLNILDFIWPPLGGQTGNPIFWAVLMDADGNFRCNIENESFTY